MINSILRIGSDVYMADDKGGKKKSKKKEIKDSIAENQPNEVPADNADKTKTKEKNSFLLFIESHSLLATVASEILVATVCSIGTAIIIQAGLPAKIENMSNIADLRYQNLTESIDDLKSGFNDHKADFQRESDYLRAEISSLDQGLNDVYGQLLLSTSLRATPAMINALHQDLAVRNDIKNSSTPTGLVATSLVAYNVVSQEELSVEQVADQRLLLPYMDGTKEVYFYGQLSATGAWDGKCIINIYEDGKLEFIKEALYDNGNLLAGRQIFAYEFKPGVDVWAISNRINSGDYSEGETWIYRWEKDYLQTFTMEDVSAKDIVDVNTFRAGLSPNPYAYYYGNTSDGYFNDTTGNAYMVHFLNNGTVRLLYVGDFKDGHFNDATGNAWYIVKEEDTDYMYYKGYFRDDKIYNLIDFEAPPLSLERIKEIIGDRTFNIELYWDKLGKS